MTRPLLFLTASLLTIISLQSCDTSTQSKSEESEKKFTRKIDPYLDTIFKVRYPNYQDNEIVRKNALKDMTKMVDSLALLGYLEDIPLKILRIQSNPRGKGAMVHFYSDDKHDTELLSDRVQFDLIGFMDEKLAETINEKNTYFVKGKKHKRLKEKEVFQILKQVYYSPVPSVEADVIYSSSYNYRFGNFLCEVDNIVPVRKY